MIMSSFERLLEGRFHFYGGGEMRERRRKTDSLTCSFNTGIKERGEKNYE
jgi:hypothetical protein